MMNWKEKKNVQKERKTEGPRGRSRNCRCTMENGETQEGETRREGDGYNGSVRMTTKDTRKDLEEEADRVSRR